MIELVNAVPRHVIVLRLLILLRILEAGLGRRNNRVVFAALGFHGSQSPVGVEQRSLQAYDSGILGLRLYR